MKKVLHTAQIIFTLVVVSVVFLFGYQMYMRLSGEKTLLKQVISRLEAESRVAEVLVTGVQFDEVTKKNRTTIKFLEYDVDEKPLKPRYFTFAGNIIQFQTLVVRFDDMHIRYADALKGKSAYLFWKVFMLDGNNTQEYTITEMHEVPDGYRVSQEQHPFEQQLWKKFWSFALNPETRKHSGVKSAQIEAPGTLFVPGILYTIYIEHDGGLRLDSKVLSPILKGEQIP